MRLAKYDEAIEAYQRKFSYSRRTCDYWVARYNIGIAHKFAGRYEEAIKAFLRCKATVDCPDKFTTQCDEQIEACEFVLHKLGRPSPQVGMLTPRAVETPSVAVSPAAEAIKKGNASLHGGDWDKAIPDFTEAIRLEPKAADAYYNRGVAYRKKGEPDKAIPDFTDAIRLEPKNANAYYNRGNAYHATRDYVKAIADYTEVIRLEPKNADAYNNRGWAYVKKGEFDKAIADYTEVIRIEPDAADAYYNRGSAYRDKGDTAKAKADFDHAKQLGYKPR